MSLIEELHTTFRQKQANLKPTIIWVVDSEELWAARDRQDSPTRTYECAYTDKKKQAGKRLNDWEYFKQKGIHPDSPRTDWVPLKCVIRKCLAVQMDGRNNQMMYMQYDKEYADMDVKIIRGVAADKLHRIGYSNVAEHVYGTKTEAVALKKAKEVRWLKDKLEFLKKEMKCRDGKRINFLEEADKLETQVIPLFEKEIDRVSKMLK